MKFTLLHHTHQGMNSYSLSSFGIILTSILLASILVTSSVMATLYYSSPQPNQTNTQLSLNSMQLHIQQADDELLKAKKMTEIQLAELTKKIGQLQAEVLRINAVGKRLLTNSGLDTKEFDFDTSPSIGGPETAPAANHINFDLLQPLTDVQHSLESKKEQLGILESVLMNKEMDISSYISGRPIEAGWNSSVFGKRIDPFTGNEAWHEGMDFAGNLGAPIVATAAGVISFVGEKSGYGLTVEINHGNNIKTRYGHNSEVLVKMGDVVAKGDQIAKMGSSGRSTGPHVHYEILKYNSAVDPQKYVRRPGK